MTPKMNILNLTVSLLCFLGCSFGAWAQDEPKKLPPQYPTESEGYEDYKSRMDDMRENMTKRFNRRDSSGNYTFQFDTTFNSNGGSFTFHFGGSNLNMAPFDSLEQHLKGFGGFDFGNLFEGFDNDNGRQGFGNFFKNMPDGFDFDSTFMRGFQGFDLDSTFSKSFGFMFDGDSFKSFGDTSNMDLFQQMEKMKENLRRTMPQFQDDLDDKSNEPRDRQKNQKAPEKKRFGDKKKSKYETEDL